MDARIPIEKMITGDGSYTLLRTDLGETYHSRNGALTESKYVFISQGLAAFPEDSTLQLLEVGFGTGLNAWLTALETGERNLHVHYHGLETVPLPLELCNQPDMAGDEIWRWLHDSPWEKETQITPHFSLHKTQTPIQTISLIPDHYNLIYFDAFAPNYQPDMWILPVFSKLYEAMAPGGILVTYCAKGEVRRTLQQAGFAVERLPGPPGKREMLRARK